MTVGRVMVEEHDSRLRLALVGALVLLACNAAVNLFLDASGRWPYLHVALEVLTTLVGMGVALALWLRWRAADRTAEATRMALDVRRVERDEWRESARRALQGLGEAVDAQLREWDLTPTEREIALFLLKGHSHKRIAEMTGRRERTVRQHGVVIYQKSGLAGRAELAAYFLEDLMLPGGEADRCTPTVAPSPRIPRR